MKQHTKQRTESREFQTSLPMYYNAREQQRKGKEEVSRQQAGQKVEERHVNQESKQRQRENNHVATERRISLNHSNTERLSSVSAKSSSPQLLLVKSKQQPKMLNVLFYLNKMPSQPFGESIETMHQHWYNDYERLQRNHSFIQWIFPNSYQSRFNNHAKPLAREQAQQFRTNPEIIRRYLKSYEMMLAFYGMKLKDKFTGELVRSRHPNYKQRFYKTLITSWHNHMRITRILTSLKETGFGKFASELCKFLKFQIYSASGDMGALRKYNVYKDWEPYEKFWEQSEPISVYFQKTAGRHKEVGAKSHLKVEPSHLKSDSIRSQRSPSRSLRSPQKQQK